MLTSAGIQEKPFLLRKRNDSGVAEDENLRCAHTTQSVEWSLLTRARGFSNLFVQRLQGISEHDDDETVAYCCWPAWGHVRPIGADSEPWKGKFH